MNYTSVIQFRWRFYETSTGRRVVDDALKKFSRDQKAALWNCLQRYGTAEQRANDVDALGGGLFELRQSLDGIALRLYFGFATDEEGDICLAVHALSKKSQKAPPSALRTARDRLADWKRRYPVRPTRDLSPDLPKMPGKSKKRH